MITSRNKCFSYYWISSSRLGSIFNSACTNIYISIESWLSSWWNISSLTQVSLCFTRWFNLLFCRKINSGQITFSCITNLHFINSKRRWSSSIRSNILFNLCKSFINFWFKINNKLFNSWFYFWFDQLLNDGSKTLRYLGFFYFSNILVRKILF